MSLLSVRLQMSSKIVNIQCFIYMPSAGLTLRKGYTHLTFESILKVVSYFACSNMHFYLHGRYCN